MLRLLSKNIKSLCFNKSILIVLFILCLLMGILSDRFFTFSNWSNILNNISVTGIVSFGVAIVLIAGGIDISFGSILACCAIVATFVQPYGALPAIICAILTGVLLGLFNGIIVAQIEANSLIATLGTQWLYLSVLFIITQGHLIQGNTENAFHFIGQGKLFNVPIPIYLLFGIGLLTWFVMKKTKYGKYVYAHGSRSTSLYYSGVDSKKVFMFAFVFMGVLTGIAGIVLSSRLVGVRPTEGYRYLIIVLTAVLLSGVALTGGVGSIFNVLIAVIVLGVIDNAMVLLGVEYKYQQLIRGVIFIFSVIQSNFLAKRMTKHSSRS